MNNVVKSWLFLFIGAFFSIGQANAQIDCAGTILTAIETTKTASFSATPTITITQRNGEKLEFLKSSFEYQRNFEDNQYLTRAYIPEENLTLISNDTGNYAIYKGEFAGEVLDNPISVLPEKYYKTIPVNEIETAQCTVREIEYNSVLCYEITMESTYDTKRLERIFTASGKNWNVDGQKIIANQTMKRVFIIGKEDKIIRAVYSFNKDGILKYGIDMGDVVIKENDAELFATPSNLLGKFLTPQILIMKYKDK